MSCILVFLFVLSFFFFLLYFEHFADSVFRLLAFHNFPFFFDIFMRKLNFPRPGPRGETSDLRHLLPSPPLIACLAALPPFYFCCCTSHGNYEGANSKHLNLNPRRLPTSGKQSEYRPRPPLSGLEKGFGPRICKARAKK